MRKFKHLTIIGHEVSDPIKRKNFYFQEGEIKIENGFILVTQIIIGSSIKTRVIPLSEVAYFIEKNNEE